MLLSCAEELRREPILRQAIEFSTDDVVRRGGVRRVDVHLVAVGEPVAVRVGPGRIGAERLLYSQIGGQPIVVRTDDSTLHPEPDARLHVTPIHGKIHWFDPTSGKRIQGT